jgi:hypothetical protein
MAGSLLHHSDAQLTNAVGRVTGDALASEPDRASGRQFETDDQLEQRTLASAVGANDSENLAIVGLHGYSVNSGEAAKALLDPIQLE